MRNIIKLLGKSLKRTELNKMQNKIFLICSRISYFMIPIMFGLLKERCLTWTVCLASPLARNFWAASIEFRPPIRRGSSIRTIISPRLSTASKAAAVLGSWSFSTASICRKISELMPDTFRKSPCNSTGSLTPPLALFACLCGIVFDWFMFMLEGIGPGGWRPGLAVRSGTDRPFSCNTDGINIKSSQIVESGTIVA